MNHLEQKVAGLRESLTSVGIGVAYHRRTLHEFAPDLFDVLNDSIVPSARLGRGIIFSGTERAYDEAILVARALHLSRVPSFVIPLTRLIRWVETDADDLTKIDESQALFVLRFAGEGERPFTPWQGRLVEEFVLSRIDNGQAFFAQVWGTLNGSRWWSEEFVKRLRDATTVRVCSESGTGFTPCTD